MLLLQEKKQTRRQESQIQPRLSLQEKEKSMIGKEESKTIQSTSSLDAKAAKENSDEIMKRMSKNIDISNQKVLETIEFLSHQSPIL